MISTWSVIKALNSRVIDLNENVGITAMIFALCTLLISAGRGLMLSKVHITEQFRAEYSIDARHSGIVGVCEVLKVNYPQLLNNTR